MAITADAASKAALSLGDRFFRRVADVDFGKRSSTSRGVEGLHVHLALHQNASRVHDVLGVKRPFQFAPRTEVLAIEPAIDRVGGFLAREHRRHHHVGTGHAVSAGEHAGQLCLHRQRIGAERSRFCGRQTQPFTQATHIGDLANCGHDSVAGNDELRAWDRFGSRPAAGIGLAQLHLLALEASYAPARVRLE